LAPVVSLIVEVNFPPQVHGKGYRANIIVENKGKVFKGPYIRERGEGTLGF
jgi:hypothetical protein